MKIRNLIGIVVMLIISIHFVTAGLAGSQSQAMVTEDFIIEKALTSKALQHSLISGDNLEPNRSIFSKTTFISLIAAVIGIVAFRRNTHS